MEMQLRAKRRLLSILVLLAATSPLYAQNAVDSANVNWQCQPNKKKWVCHKTLNYSQSIYNKQLSAQQHRAAVANALGWVADNSDSANNCSVCGGHYVEKKFNPKTRNLPLSKAKSKVTFGQSQYKVQGAYQLSGGVLVIQPNRTIYADQATLKPNLKTGKLQQITAKGHIRVDQPGQVILGQYLHANINNHKASADDVTYLTKITPSLSGQMSGPPDRNFTGYAHGETKTIHQISKDLFVLHDATYATCPPTEKTWALHASTLVLNKESGRGHAYNVVLDAQGVPVFYFPYLSFPINKKRQTGFLYGSIGQSGSTGLSLFVPFYLNLAPNYDDTFTPAFYSKRGVVFNNLFRYLLKPNWFAQRSEGLLDISYMPYDRGQDPNHHFYAHTENQTIINNHWTASADASYVSDKSYMDDFISVDSLMGANTTLLNQQANLSYNSAHWNFNGLIQQYQVVDKTLELTNRPYKRLPELDLNANYPHIVGPFNFSMQSQFVNFAKSDADGEIPVQGQRLLINPQISLPLTASYGFFKPAVTFSNTFYALENTAVNNFPDSHVTRTLPIYDIDTGLMFERNFLFGGKDYSQTLEPRLFYLYIPYRNQNNIPVFDTTLTNFDFSQLFVTNRFAGQDRINNANQLSAAVTSSVLNSKGRDILDGGIGEIFYFAHRKVSLCRNNLNPNCIDSENPFHDAAKSDIAGQFNYHINPDWLFHADITFNPNNSQFDNENYQFQYQPDAYHIFNLGYQTNASDYALLSTQQILDGVSAPRLSQLTTSAYWGLTPTISLIGYWDYSINANRTLDIFGGIEYNSCSWAVRFIVRHYMQNSNPNVPIDLNGAMDTVTMVQFELKGLGSTGSSGINQLIQQIPGYGQPIAGSI